MKIYKSTIEYAIKDQRHLAFNYQEDSKVIHPYIFGRWPDNKEFVIGLLIEGSLIQIYDFSQMTNITIIEGAFGHLDLANFKINKDQWLEIFEANKHLT